MDLDEAKKERKEIIKDTNRKNDEFRNGKRFSSDGKKLRKEIAEQQKIYKKIDKHIQKMEEKRFTRRKKKIRKEI